MMRSLPAWTLAGACALAVSLGAQGATDQYKSTQKSDTKGMTLTGCLQAGTTPGTFTLTNATTSQRASADKPTEPPTATPTEEAVGTSGKAKTYDLTAKTGVDLSAHVGHKVEVTTEPAAAKGAESSTTTEMKTATPKLTVSAIKHVSPTCP
jgi:hypothetical protein